MEWAVVSTAFRPSGAAFAGGHDRNPGQGGLQGMRQTAKWLRGRGAIVVAAIKDAGFGHGALHLNPQNCSKALKEFLTVP
jgi:hypothetical protein